MDRIKKKMQQRHAPAKPLPRPCPFSRHEGPYHWAGGFEGWVPCTKSR
ncbi:hypothetical protein [Actinoplanes friuliensis]|nr:hypothetical protein [Actinoplanes friuliensis]